MRRDFFGRAVAVVCVGFAVALTACGGGGSSGGDGGAPDASGRWNCPDGWVPYAIGGCGPAVWLCAGDGGAAPGACTGVTIDQPSLVATDDGGMGATLYVLPDGAIGGAWPQPGADGGPPAADWTPDAGIPSCPLDHAWMQASDGTCDPLIRSDCPSGTGPLPGGRCTMTAESDCPSTPFADVHTETTTAVYVLAGADPASADGTMAHPDATIAAGIARAGAGGWVLVGSGTYTESLTLSADVHVVGVCAAHTIVQPGAGNQAFDVTASGAHADLRNLTVSGGNGIAVRLGANATVSRMRLRGVAHRAIVAQGIGALLTVSQTVIDSTLPVPGAEAFGIDALSSAHVTATDVSVLETQGIAFDADTAANLSIADSYVLGAASANAGGPAVYAGGRAHVDVQRSMFVHNTAAGIVVTQDGTQVTAADVVIRDTMELPNQPVGQGVGAGIVTQLGGAATADRVLIDHTVGFGAQELTLQSSPFSSITLRSSVVRDTRSFHDGMYGIGISGGIYGGTVTVANVIVDGSHEAGIGVSTANAGITDTIVRNTQPNAMGKFGWGIEADYDGSLMLSRVRIENSAQVGLAATSGGNTMVQISDSVISQSDVPTTSVAIAVQIQCHASMDASRIHVIGGVGAGLFAGDGCPPTMGLGDVTPGLTTVNLSDSVVEQTRAVSNPNVGTTAVIAETGAVLNAERCAVLSNDEFGVVAANAGTQLTWSDGIIADTRLSSAGTFGTALVGDQQATVSATRAYIRGAFEFGVLAIDGASASLADTLVDTVGASGRGYGLGVASAVGGTLTAERLGIRNVAGAGIASVSDEGTRQGIASMPAQLSTTDLFVQGVQPSTFTSGGAMASYGLHASSGSTLDIQRGVVDVSSYGFFASGAALTIHTGVIARQRDALGADNGPPLMLVDVLSTQNATDMVVTNTMLPSGAGLAPPPLPAGCTSNGCM